MVFLTVDDLTPFVSLEPAKAQVMIDDAVGLAVLAAPCLATEPSTLTDTQVAAVKAILRGAIVRWVESGSGAIQSQTIGSFSQTFETSQHRRGMFWPSEITQLQGICSGTPAGRAFGIDTTPTSFIPAHLDICALMFGALYCSCGAALAGTPLFEGA